MFAKESHSSEVVDSGLGIARLHTHPLLMSLWHTTRVQSSRVHCFSYVITFTPSIFILFMKTAMFKSRAV